MAFELIRLWVTIHDWIVINERSGSRFLIARLPLRCVDICGRNCSRGYPENLFMCGPQFKTFWWIEN